MPEIVGLWNSRYDRSYRWPKSLYILTCQSLNSLLASPDYKVEGRGVPKKRGGGGVEFRV